MAALWGDPASLDRFAALFAQPDLLVVELSTSVVELATQLRANHMGLDSLMALELMVLREKNLGITLTEVLIFENPTIEDLVQYFMATIFGSSTEKRSLIVDGERHEGSGDEHGQDCDRQTKEISELGDDEILKIFRSAN